MMGYSVVLVARDRSRQLLGTLLALKRFAAPAEVLLVDNASSTSLTGPARLSQLPVRHIRLEEHRSLSAAFNAGLDQAAHEFVVLLHLDTVLLSGPAVAVQFLENNPDVGVVGGKLLSGGERPWRVRHVGYEVGRGRVGPRHRGRGEWATFNEAVDVEAVSDALLVLRRSEIRFDERYWFRLQDVDLCYQYRQRRQRVVYLPELQAIHTENGGAAERNSELHWASRQLASNLLYHERWCSDTALDDLPLRAAIGGQAAVDYLRQIDNRYTSGDAA